MTEKPQATPAKSYVTMSLFVTVLGILVAAAGSLNTFIWAQHARHPHAGAVSDKEMHQFEKRVDQGFETLKHQLNRIEAKLDK